jgi:NTE family protein
MKLLQGEVRTEDREAHRSRASTAETRPAGRRETKAAVGVKGINVALQGGGAHGAFAWGVLDKLLEDGRLAIEGITGTSAGSMNATVLAYGLYKGGREGARETLASFWRRVSDEGRTSPLQPSLLDRILHNHSLAFSPVFLTFDLMTRLFSPYQLNPFNYNPLRKVLEQTVDFADLRRCTVTKLYLSATNVRTGKVKVFDTSEVTADAVMASACLPFLFQAVEIDGEAYWDGGYMGNPALFPLIHGCQSKDIVIVHINPLCRPDVPKTATDIMNRVNEISFNSSLMREMRAIAFATRLVDEGKVAGSEMKQMNMHSIAADDFMQGLGVFSKLNADWEFLTHLRDVGRDAAKAWLATNYDKVNKESTVDFSVFL